MRRLYSLCANSSSRAAGSVRSRPNSNKLAKAPSTRCKAGLVEVDPDRVRQLQMANPVAGPRGARPISSRALTMIAPLTVAPSDGRPFCVLVLAQMRVSRAVDYHARVNGTFCRTAKDIQG